MSPKRAAKRLHRWLIPPESEQGWTAYLWLVYLVFFSIEWWFRPVPPLEAALAALTLAVFLVLYFSAHRRSGRAALAHIAALGALGLAWAPLNAGASVFFIYAGAFAFRVGPPRISAWVVAGIAAVAAVAAVLFQPLPFYYLPGVFITAISGAANICFGEQHRRNAELRLTQAEVKRLARVAERERIARDLHDLLGHTLSLIAVKSELAGRLIERDPDRAADELDSIHASARQALSEVREAIGGFREQGLDEALEHARASLRAADVEPEIGRDRAIDIGRDREAMLALVIREAVTNILRHADASRCRIRLAAADRTGAELTIADDGRGRVRPDGGGVQGMRARLEALGGALEIGEDGKTLRARIPERGE